MTTYDKILLILNYVFILAILLFVMIDYQNGWFVSSLGLFFVAMLRMIKYGEHEI